jgi:HPt (histidine-containing phosphotransfer) domain-containing protein
MSAILDAETLEVLIEAIGEDGARGVIELFLGECQELTAAITSPAADLAAIGRAAHSLKSSAGQLGALALSEAAMAVEAAAHAGSGELPRLTAALARYAAETQMVLAEKLK